MKFGKPRASMTGCAVRNLISVEPGKATGVRDLGEDPALQKPWVPTAVPRQFIHNPFKIVNNNLGYTSLLLQLLPNWGTFVLRGGRPQMHRGSW